MRVLDFDAGRVDRFLSFPDVFDNIGYKGHLFAVLVQQRDVDNRFVHCFAIVRHVCTDIEYRLAQVISCEGSGQIVIAQAQLGSREQINIAMDTAQAEHILVFQVAAVAPTVHFDSQDVLSRLYIFRDIELCVVIRSLAVPDFLSVHPEVHCTVDSVEMDKDFTSFPVVRNIEVTAVGADRVGFVHNRVSFLALYERRVVAMRIRDVCINRSTVSVHFPIGRNRNFFPAGNIVVRFIEIDRTFGRLFYPIEFPVAVQQLVARRVRAKPGFAVVWRTFQAFHGREGDISRMPRLLVDSEDSFVLPILVTGTAQGLLINFDV